MDALQEYWRHLLKVAPLSGEQHQMRLRQSFRPLHQATILCSLKTLVPTMSHSSSSDQQSVSFEVYVSKDSFKFNAAHFVAFEGYRERLHGHNYRVGVRLLGRRTIGADGYLIDFAQPKNVTKAVCKRLNEHFLCPMHSNVLKIDIQHESVRLTCQDGSVFVFPKGDCALLPIVHATAEELAVYLYAEILNGLDAGYLKKRKIHTMEVTVAEAPGQEATFRLAIPDNQPNCTLDVREFIEKGKIVPVPCLKSTDGGCQQCACSNDALDRLATAINDGALNVSGPVTADDLIKASIANTSSK